MEVSNKQNLEEMEQFNEKEIRHLFKLNPDVVFHTHSFSGTLVTLIACEGMIDGEALNNVVYERLKLFFEERKGRSVREDEIIRSLHLPSLSKVKTKERIVAEIFSGRLLIFFVEEKFIYSTDISKRPQRNPEETSTEVTIKGPRDDFTEDIVTNIALVRKRLRTESLAIKKYELGTRTQTQIAVLYLDDVANEEILIAIDDKMKQIEVDGIYSGTQLKELLSNRKYNIYPIFHYTGRPDFVVNSLLNGRFIILVDGVQYAIIAPVNLAFLLKTAEDSENIFLYNSFERAIRVIGILIAIFVPGLWVALISFHQNQIPIAFLGTIIESRKGVPLPAAIEAIFMLFLFEFFKEAGLRLPLAIGSTLSVVGGLIIGDAAIRAGLASPLMIVLIATSAVTTYTLVSLSLHGIVSILRFFVIIVSSFFGLYGFFIAMFLIILYGANIQTFGVNYLSVPETFNIKQILKTIFRLPEVKYKTRPELLKPDDKTKKPQES